MKWAGRTVQSYKKWSVFSVLRIWVILLRFLCGFRSDIYMRNAWNDKIVTCSSVDICFYFVLWTTLAGRNVQSYEKWFFSVFLCVWVCFPMFLGRLRSGLYYISITWWEWYMQCRAQWALIWFVVKISREKCSNLWKIIIFKFCYWFGSFSPSFWAREGVAYIRIAWNNKSATCRSVANCFHFVLWSRLARRNVQSYEKC